MKITDKGVIEPSFMDFSLPSKFAETALYYSLQFGHFICNNEYNVSRNEPLDSFLLFYILDGELLFNTMGNSFVGRKNQIIFLNCKIPHIYSCNNKCDFIWFHFNGNSALHYYLYLSQKYGNVFKEHEKNPVLLKSFTDILSIGRKPIVNEHLISFNVHRILSCLATQEENIPINELLYPAIKYISENFYQPVNLKILSDLCNISLSHFIRCFKKYLNCTPHEYIMSYRLRQSKYLLMTSQLSIEEISDKCGFNSASHFTRTFKRVNKITPSKFRYMQL